MKHYSIRIYGKVQNVGFRFYTINEAKQLNIKGYVKNEPDGTVYIEAEGEEVPLLEFISWCRKGPTWARVGHIEANESPVMNYKDFKIK
jgi:acylphosphatase